MNSQHSPSRPNEERKPATAAAGNSAEKKILFADVAQFAKWLDNELFELEQEYDSFVTCDSSKLNLEKR